MKILGTIRQSVAHGILGGMELVSHDLYRGLVQHGHQVEVLTSSLKHEKETKERIIDGVKYIFISQAPSGVYSNEFHRGVVDYFKELSVAKQLPDIIHSCSGAALSLVNNAEKINVIATWHGTRFEEELDKLADYAYVQSGRLLPIHFEKLFIDGISKIIQKNDFGKFDAHVAISPFMKQCIEAYGVEKDKIHVILNALPQYFNRDLKERKRSSTKIVIGLVGRLIPMKGHQFFAQVAKKLDPEKFELLLVGAGESHSVYEDCGLKVNSLRVARESIPDLYSKMDIFLNPTFRYSGFDLTVQEALASGIVTIVSDVAPYHEYYNDLKKRYEDKSPLLEFRVADVESCLGAINRAIVSNINNIYGEDFQKEFDFDVMIQNYIALFEKYKKRLVGYKV